MDVQHDWERHRGERPELADALELWVRADRYAAVACDLHNSRRGSIIDRDGLVHAHWQTGYRLRQRATSMLSAALTGRRSAPLSDGRGPAWWSFGTEGPSPAELYRDGMDLVRAAESVPALAAMYREWREGLPALRSIRDALSAIPDPEPGALDVDAALRMLAPPPGGGVLVVHAPIDPALDDSDSLTGWSAPDDDDPDADGAGVSFNPLDYIEHNEGSNP